MIITELYDQSLGELPVTRLLPRPDIKEVDTWWSFTPSFFIQALGCLGFEKAEISVHHQHGPEGNDFPMFTVVAHRPD